MAETEAPAQAKAAGNSYSLDLQPPRPPSTLPSHPGSARDQMLSVWRGLEEEVKRGNVELGSVAVLRNYIKVHWRFPASEPPFVRE